VSRLDSRAIGELRELMGEDFAALIDAFQSDSEAQIAAIDVAAANGAAEHVRRQAHGLKGACINLGANDLAELCGRIEEAGRAADCKAALGLVAPLRLEFGAVREALDALRQPLR
jgi:HPt (histidine-containing phosphotransfer) domain-containing protein